MPSHVASRFSGYGLHAAVVDSRGRVPPEVGGWGERIFGMAKGKMNSISQVGGRRFNEGKCH